MPKIPGCPKAYKHPGKSEHIRIDVEMGQNPDNLVEDEFAASPDRIANHGTRLDRIKILVKVKTSS
jgi:hypothetical protein